MPIDVTATLQKALDQLEAEETRLTRKITAVRNALEQLPTAPRSRPEKSQSQSNGREKKRREAAAERSKISARRKRCGAKRRSQAKGRGRRKAAKRRAPASRSSV